MKFIVNGQDVEADSSHVRVIITDEHRKRMALQMQDKSIIGKYCRIYGKISQTIPKINGEPVILNGELRYKIIDANYEMVQCFWPGHRRKFHVWRKDIVIEE